MRVWEVVAVGVTAAILGWISGYWIAGWGVWSGIELPLPGWWLVTLFFFIVGCGTVLLSRRSPRT